MTIPPGYKELKKGDIIKSTDLFYDRNDVINSDFLTELQATDAGYSTYIGEKYREKVFKIYLTTIRKNNLIKLTAEQKEEILSYLKNEKANNADKAIFPPENKEDFFDAAAADGKIKSINWSGKERYFL